ncbi:annexin-B12-like isoform X2 [Oratosquilla oratoria]|uniref:annexin-B12-like isoform X2 n=1 Tax=Oratosquilla oratoria TaxID=337810 RepID=UPI003F7728E2
MNPNQQGYPPAPGVPYPPSPYPPTGAPYPPSGAPYPPTGAPYPPTGAPYPPTGAPYPPSGAPYPPSGAPYPPTGAPYPPAGNPYPTSGVPYPTAGAPAQVPGGSPYPPAGSYPPASQYPPGGAPDPAASQYPPTGQPYPPPGAQAGGQYPPPGGSPYPAPPGGAAYPPSSGSPYPPPSSSYPPPPQPGGPVGNTSIYSTSSSAPRANMAAALVPYTQIPTIKSLGSFDASTDASSLRKAMKGFGTDEKAIIHILANRTNIQRQQILLKYQQSYGRDLVHDLKSELGGKLETVVLALMTPLYQYLAQEIHHAIDVIGTKERALVEILCTADNATIHHIKNEYFKLYNKKIEDDIRGDTSGDFQRLLISMIAGAREEHNCDPSLAPSLAQQLYEAGEGKKLGTDESEFNRIMANYSYPLLRLVFEEYEKIKGKPFSDAIKSELSGDLEKGMLAIYRCIQNRAAFFAVEIHDAMSGAGTNDRALIRLIVTRSEIDMGNIKEEYVKIYEKPLEKDIKDDTSGDYKKILLDLIED